MVKYYKDNLFNYWIKYYEPCFSQEKYKILFGEKKWKKNSVRFYK